ncbi:MAG: hypothetical protein QXD42_06870 [Nitrososphaerales archaeon]
MQESCSKSTTTLNFGRMKGLSLDIIFILCEEDQPLRTIDIANILGKKREIVYQYLRRMALKGLINYEQGLWLALGSAIKLYKILKRLHEDKKEIIQREHKDSMKIKFTNQIKIDHWLSNYNPTEAEEVIVNALVEHYNRTHQLGILLQNPYDYYEHGIHLSPEDFNRARISLQNEGIITWGRYKDKGAWKLALKKDFLINLSKY